MSTLDMWQIENSLYSDDVQIICGVDEAGRGPLAGPVCAAAVILPKGLIIPGLNDSKKLTDKKRRELFPVIKEQALAYAIAFANHNEIDDINILQATYLAMERAIAMLQIKPDLALIDGNRAKDFGIPVKTVVHGDSLSASIAAASVLAKVTRDDYMNQMAEQYPQYGFEIHKGYGTKAHYSALREHGHCPIHRRSFLKNSMGRNNIAGAWGEALAAKYLQKKRYTILATGYRCRYGEIDIIASNRKYLAFVEVKLRKSDRFASAYEYVDSYKQERIRTTASFYLAENPTSLQPRFDVIEIYAAQGIHTLDPVINHMEDAFE